MSDTPNPINGGAGVRDTADTVVCVTFDPDNNAYEAFSALKQLDAEDRLTLSAASVVVRGQDGRLVVKDEVDKGVSMTAGGGLIGLLIGVLGGPLGILIGGTSGLLFGSLGELAETDRSESLLGEISASLQPGKTALLAQLTEPSYDAVDTAMGALGGTVLRRPIVDVEAEIAAAEKAQRHAQREADKELVRAQAQQDKVQARAKLQELKAKLRGGEKAATPAR
jgi:uncharacterized membrane protein